MRYLSFCLAVTLAPVPAQAVPTHVGEGTYPLAGTTAAQQPSLSGTVIRDDLVPFVLNLKQGGKPTAAIAAHGTIQVRVVKAADGTLSFYWKINNAADSAQPLGMLVIDFVPDHAYDANWRSDGLGTIAPDGLQAVLYPSGKYQYRFIFASKPITPGASSRFFFLKTTATKQGKAMLAPLGLNNSTSTSAVAGVAPAF